MSQLASFESPSVRKTPDEKFSIYDAIRVIAQKGNERLVWKRLVEQHPDIAEDVTSHLFPMSKGKVTPVASMESIVKIIDLLPSGRRSRMNDVGYVYLISADGIPMVKIGKSVNPHLRLATHQISSPVKLSLVATASTSFMTDTERGLKEFFREFRSHGEWYRVGVDKARFIFDDAVAACKSFQDVAENATTEELDKLSTLMELQTKALQKADARGHSEISSVIQLAANDFQAMLERFGVV
jgi:hypothetical protein